MPSTCPKCRETVPEDIVCCAEVSYLWKCASCHKVASGFIVPYGKCFLCGGALTTLASYDIGDPLRLRPIRDALQFELNAYHFYRLALQRAKDPLLRAIFTELYQNEVDHLHTLQERYHAHLDEDVLTLRPDAEALLGYDLFRGLDLMEPAGGASALYEKAIAMERRTRDHFRQLAAELPDGDERRICQELAAEEEEHVALLETEREQFTARAAQGAAGDPCPRP